MTTMRARHRILPRAVTLPFAPESAGLARDRLTDSLRQQRLSTDELDDARLILSELVGNALRHALPLSDRTLQVSWSLESGTLDIAVSDGGAPTRPRRVEAGVSDLAGRGMAIVEALSDRWWVETARARTTVHAVLTTSADADLPSDVGPDLSSG